jgi:hypothetical protein
VALDHSCQVQRHTYAERGLDFYQTPACATDALLKVEKIPHSLWDPAAGLNGIANPLRAAGHSVITSEIVDRGGDLDFVADFYSQTSLPAGVEGLITNPPYRECAKAAPFVRHALDLSPTVVLLMRLAFYESDARTEILEQRGLLSIHVFRPLTHDAQGGMERTQKQQRNGLLLDAVGTRLRRADDC